VFSTIFSAHVKTRFYTESETMLLSSFAATPIYYKIIEIWAI